MAQELIPLQTSDNKKKSEAVDIESEAKKNLEVFLRGYSSLHSASNEVDTLDGRYKIDLNSPLADFNSNNTKAYLAVNLKNPEKPYVAFVCDSGTIQRNKIIYPLINAPHPNLMVIVSSGIVELSRPKEERFVIICEKPRGEKISKLIAATKHRPNFEFICQAVITPLSLAVNHLAELGITHGSINCENIYFDTSGIGGVVINQCVSEPCGLSQPFYYEPIERMQSLPHGKGDGDSSLDYYAVAVVILHIIYGMNHFTGLSQESLIKNILKEGAFNSLTRNKDMPEVFYDFFRGMLSYNSHDRWNYKYLKAWLDGKRYNVMPTPPPHEAIRPFEFGEELAYTRREAANLFFRHWQDMPEIFATGQLNTWVAISLRNKELNEYLLRTTKMLNSSASQNVSYINEQIMRVITVFDPAGPIRLKKLSFNLDGMNALFADLILKNSESELQLLMQFIELSMFHFVAEQKNREFEKLRDTENNEVDLFIVRLERMRAIVRNTGLGFGTERILYDLNPNMQCLSPMLAGKHVSSLPALLKTLDQMASSSFAGSDPIDRHIAAFLASHMGIQHEIYLSSLSAQPALAKNPVMIALKLLASAQHKSRLNYLPGLSNWLAMRIIPLFDVIRSKTLKKKLITMLANSARSGNIPKMADMIIESGYAQAEVKAFQQAIYSYKQNEEDINYYTQREMFETHSRQLGARMAHYVAIIALLFSFINSVWGN